MSGKILNTQKPTKIFVDDENEAPYNIPSRIVNILRATDNFGELFGLFGFFCVIARDQKTNKIYANTKFTEINSGWGKDKIRALKKELIQLGLIEEIEQRNSDGKWDNTYIKLLFKWNESFPQEPSPPDPPSKTTPKSPSPLSKKQNKIKEEIKKRYLPIASQLAKIIMDNKNIVITSAQKNEWAKHIRLLSRTSKISTKRILAALDWYGTHINDKYIPVIQSGKSFREKFLQLESAMGREAYSSKKNSQSQHENISQEKLDIYDKLTKVVKS